MERGFDLKKSLHALLLGFTVIALVSTACAQNVFRSKETLRFQSRQFEVVSELRIPEGEGPHPLVIFVHGDGPAYRNSFSTLKKVMLEAGYATFIWDKPGYGESTGEFTKGRLRAERAVILMDAIKAMKTRSEIENNRIGVWGISQAGWVIPRVLEQSDDIAFMILVGCGGETGIQQTAYLIKRQLELEGLSAEEAESMENHFIQIYNAKTFEEYIVHARPLYENQIQRELGFVSALWDETNYKPIPHDSESFYDPMDVMNTVTIPALVFFGEKDTQVDPVQGAQAYEKAFQKAGNTNYRIETIPGTDHNIILCETGSMKERSRRSGRDWSRYGPEYLEIMGSWLRALKE